MQQGVLSAAIFVAGASASWAVGSLIEKTVQVASEDSPLAADVSTTGSLQGELIPISVPELRRQFSPETMISKVSTAYQGAPANPLGITIDTYGVGEAPVIIRGLKLIEVACSAPETEVTFVEVAGGRGLLWPPLKV